MSRKNETDSEDYYGLNPFQDTSDRYLYDQIIRSYGYRVYSRPRVGEVTWCKGGKVYTQSEVVRLIDDPKLTAAIRAAARVWRMAG